MNIQAVFERLVSGLAKLLGLFSDIYVLLRFGLIVLVTFLAGRAISARRAPEVVRTEISRDPIEDLLLRAIGSETAPDIVNLAMIYTVFNLLDKLIRLIEGTDLINKEEYFPPQAMERLRTLIVDVEMKVEDLKQRLNIPKDYRETIQSIVSSSIEEYCLSIQNIPPEMGVTGVAAVKPAPSPEELKREKTREELEKAFELRTEKPEKEKPSDLEQRMKEIVDMIENYGV